MIENREYAPWRKAGLSDMYGKTFDVGDDVIKVFVGGRSPIIAKCVVSRIESGKLYLDGSKVAIQFPSRLLNLTKYVQEYKENNHDV